MGNACLHPMQSMLSFGKSSNTSSSAFYNDDDDDDDDVEDNNDINNNKSVHILGHDSDDESDVNENANKETDEDPDPLHHEGPLGSSKKNKKGATSKYLSTLLSNLDFSAFVANNAHIGFTTLPPINLSHFDSTTTSTSRLPPTYYGVVGTQPDGGIILESNVTWAQPQQLLGPTQQRPIPVRTLSVSSASSSSSSHTSSILLRPLNNNSNNLGPNSSRRTSLRTNSTATYSLARLPITSQPTPISFAHPNINITLQKIQAVTSSSTSGHGGGPLILPRTSSLTTLVLDTPDIVKRVMMYLGYKHTQRLSRLNKAWRECARSVLTKQHVVVTLGWDWGGKEWSLTAFPVEEYVLDDDDRQEKKEEVNLLGDEEDVLVDFPTKRDSSSSSSSTSMWEAFSNSTSLSTSASSFSSAKLLQHTTPSSSQPKLKSSKSSKSITITKYKPATFNMEDCHPGPLPISISELSQIRLTPLIAAPARMFKVAIESPPGSPPRRQRRPSSASSSAVNSTVATTAFGSRAGTPAGGGAYGTGRLSPFNNNTLKDVRLEEEEEEEEEGYSPALVTVVEGNNDDALSTVSMSPSTTSSSSSTSLTECEEYTLSPSHATSTLCVRGRLPRKDHVFADVIFGKRFGLVMTPSGTEIDSLIVITGESGGRAVRGHGSEVDEEAVKNKQRMVSQRRWRELCEYVKEFDVPGGGGVKDSAALRYYLSCSEAERVWAFRGVMETLIAPLYPERGHHELNEIISRIDRISHRVDILCQVDVPGSQRRERLRNYFSEGVRAWLGVKGGDLALRVSGFKGSVTFVKGEEEVFEHLVGVLLPAFT